MFVYKVKFKRSSKGNELVEEGGRLRERFATSSSSLSGSSRARRKRGRNETVILLRDLKRRKERNEGVIARGCLPRQKLVLRNEVIIRNSVFRNERVFLE